MIDLSTSRCRRTARFWSCLAVGWLWIGFAAAASSHGEDLKFTAGDSKIEFTGAKPGGQHTGSFASFRGTFDSNTGAMSVDIDMASVQTDDKKLTAHLKSPDFFDVRAFPTATFVSRSVASQVKGDKTHLIQGDLQLHGVKRPVSIPASIRWEGKVLALRGDWVIRRSEFGINYGAGQINDEVSLRFALLAKAAAQTSRTIEENSTSHNNETSQNNPLGAASQTGANSTPNQRAEGSAPVAQDPSSPSSPPSPPTQPRQTRPLLISSQSSRVEFVGAKPQGRHTGGFRRFHGEFDTAQNRVKLTIDMSSVYTDDQKLTNHLMSPDFFDVRQHPTATLVSTGIRPDKIRGGHLIEGDLTLHGVKRRISAPASIQWKGASLVVAGRLILRRSDFGIKYGAGQINEEVPITFQLTAQPSPQVSQQPRSSKQPGRPTGRFRR